MKQFAQDAMMAMYREITALRKRIEELEEDNSRMKEVVTLVQVNRHHFTEQCLRIGILKQCYKQFWGKPAPEGMFDESEGL